LGCAAAAASIDAYPVDEVVALGGHLPEQTDWYPGLPAEHFLADGLAVPAEVGPLADQQFVGDDAHCVEVGAEGVVLAEEHLGSHVPRSAAGLLRIFWLPKAGDAEVGDAGVSPLVQDDVFGLDVPVDDVPAVQAGEPLHEAAHEELYLNRRVLIWGSLKMTPRLR
jgi:hypothetical protein